ncbi:MAG TPA: heme-copper oxidase subunit III [Pyrinomonadaceae bacterium]|nr:heme-copper oxidase subunit III [Pyrinomonadaceae bacterium]
MSLKIGTVETTNDVEPEKKRKRSGLSGGGSPGGGGGRRRGGGGGGGDNGGDNPNKDRSFEEIEEFRPDKLRVAMWFTLLVVMMTFGGLIGAYIVLSTNQDLEWKPFALPVQVWFSTALIIASSLSYKIAQNNLNRDRQTAAKQWLLATTVLGGIFISSQILLWFQLVRSGVYMQSNPYAGFFYILTAVHALHVFGGICALGYMVLRAWRETGSEEELERRKTAAAVVGWYWHFMDGLWIVLILLLGFFK